MKFYNQRSKFTFGKYNGCTLEQVFETEISYVEWCLINLEHFVISDDVLALLYGTFPGRIRSEAEEARLGKNDPEPDDYDPMDHYGRRGRQYDWYNGWSDDVINDVFDSNPEAT